MPSNDKQVGGDHYGLSALQHWDVVRIFGLSYLEGQITKYIFRWRKKNGLEDLKKAQHYLEKLIEENSPVIPTPHQAEFDYSEMVKPTGWLGFTFEGSHALGDLYTCKVCRKEVNIPTGSSPHVYHGH